MLEDTEKQANNYQAISWIYVFILVVSLFELNNKSNEATPKLLDKGENIMFEEKFDEKSEEKLKRIKDKMNEKLEKILSKEDIAYEDYSILVEEFKKLNCLKSAELSKQTNKKLEAQRKEVYETLMKSFMNEEGEK